MKTLASLCPELEMARKGDMLFTNFFETKITSPGDHCRLNRLFRYFTNRSEQFKSCGDWENYILLHLPKHREIAFFEVSEQIPSPFHNRIVGQIWTDPEIIHSGSCFIAAAALRSPPHRLWDVMTEEELLVLNSLPEILTIYRSHESRNQLGHCWTLNREIAESFGYGYNWRELTTARVARDSILGYFNRRGEDEIVIRACSELEIQDLCRLD